MICIWCQTDYKSLSIEHAIPEALGCPPDLILDNIACTQCNNSLGKVDHALIKQFEILSVMFGIKRKGRRQPTIDSWSAISSAYREGGHQIYLNGGPGTVEANGKRLPAAKKSNGIEGTWVKPEEGRMGLSQQFGNDPLFLPSLYKVGLSLVAFHFGAEIASASAYDHVRAFVRSEYNAPFLNAALDINVDPSGRHHVSGPIVKDGREYPMFELQLLGVPFLLDMAPDQPGIRDLRGAATLMNQPLYVFPTPKA